jgi:hypothetical protein
MRIGKVGPITERRFPSPWIGTLRAALLFVLETLSDNERRTALVELYFWPFKLDFGRPEVLEASKSWHAILAGLHWAKRPGRAQRDRSTRGGRRCAWYQYKPKTERPS